MPVRTGEIVLEAYKNGYAVPAFSVHSYDMVEAVCREAEEQGMPILLQVGQRAIKNGQMPDLCRHIREISAAVSTPVGIHLDHSHTFEQVAEALYAGVTSCMIDTSHLPFEENIRVSKEVVRMCHAAGVPVEGELGTIGGVEDDVNVKDEDVQYTSVQSAVEFVKATGVDTLAVAIGSAHGMYKQTPHLQLARLKEIHEALDIPLVLHGGSGIPEDQILQAIKLGIAKINFDTELRLAFVEGLKNGAETHSDDPFNALKFAKNHLRQTVRQKIDMCFGKAGVWQ